MESFQKAFKNFRSNGELNASSGGVSTLGGTTTSCCGRHSSGGREGLTRGPERSNTDTNTNKKNTNKNTNTNEKYKHTNKNEKYKQKHKLK